MKAFLLLCMIFAHIVDDYYLQGILAKLKQREWWKENAPDDMYKNDYKVALLMHAFSWAFMVMLPAVIFRTMEGLALPKATLAVFVINMMQHAWVDDLKANKREINLITDQAMHMVQIVTIWMIFVMV